MDADRINIVERIVEKAGGQSALARICGIKPQSVQTWLVKLRYVPPLRVLACEQASGIPRWEIRPDLYPPPRKYRTRADRAQP